MVSNEKPTCFLIQETKVTKEGRIKIPGYHIVERGRREKTGGGLMIGIDKSIKEAPVVVCHDIYHYDYDHKVI